MGWTVDQLERWIDCQMVDSEGRKVGTIADVYVDDATGEPEWLAVHTGLLGSHISFVPLAGAREEGGRVHVVHSKEVIKASPNIPVHGELTANEEERLYRHYGLHYDGRPITEVVDDASDIAKSTHQSPNVSGSASMTDVSPQIARTRLRRRDAAAVDAIDLRSDDVDSPV